MERGEGEKSNGGGNGDGGWATGLEFGDGNVLGKTNNISYFDLHYKDGKPGQNRLIRQNE